MNRIFVLTSMFFLFGCSTILVNKGILIEDYLVGSAYEIVAVDGRQPNRAEHGILVTVVPLVLVSEGKHILTVRLNNINTSGATEAIGPPIEIEVEVINGNRYRVINKNGGPVLVINSET